MGSWLDGWVDGWLDEHGEFIMSRRLALGLDFGTESARALLVDVTNGDEVGSATAAYSHGVIDDSLPGSDRPLPPDWALQCPGDYLQALEQIVPEALSSAGASGAEVIGIGLDHTACTLLPTTADGTPLCETDQWRMNPHAWVKLWKHHGAADEADAINALAVEREEPFLQRYGGKTSSEWMLAKAWETLNDAPEVYAAADHFIEAVDWLTWQLTGELRRNACCAGYKGMWSREEGFPNSAFLDALDSRLEGFVEEKLKGPVLPVGSRAGQLTAPMAERLGLQAGTPVAVGIIDAHAAVAAAGIAGPGPVLIIMGTSTCHMALSDETRLFPGMAGVVQDGIVPGFAGYEAGQSATGDIYGWFVENAVPQGMAGQAAAAGMDLHPFLEQRAATLAIGGSGLVALDWWNGNRSVLMDANLSGLIVGLTLDTRPEEIYRALIEATAFGTRAILENFEANGLPVTELIACGGLAEKNELLMQIHANVCGKPFRLVRSGQASALGAAIFGAVAAGAEGGGYATVQEAAAAMGGLKERTYYPTDDAVLLYNALYKEYLALHDLFGRGGTEVMRRLKAMKQAAARVSG